MHERLNEIAIPYFIVRDETSALTKLLMKVLTGKHNKGTKEWIFNQRTSWAHRVVENLNGISSSNSHGLRNPLLLESGKAMSVVMPVATYHNFLRRNTRAKNVLQETAHKTTTS